MTGLWIALAGFVGSHFLLSHPLRRPLVDWIGERAFLGLYSLVALAAFAWVIWAFGRAPDGAPYWATGDALQIAATLIMLVASVLLVGSFFGNPAFPHPGASGPAPQPRGVFGITRHPMMWAFALWGLAHVLVSPRPPVIALAAGIALLALGGAAAQDTKKAALQGTLWTDWTRSTAFTPFGRGWSNPGIVALAGGILLWLAATWVHPLLGAPVAGIWQWLG